MDIKFFLQESIKDSVDRFVTFTKSGGLFSTMPGPVSIFSQREVISQLHETLKMHNIPGLNKELFLSQSSKIMLGILGILAETKIKIDNGDISDCYLSAVEKDDKGATVYFCFKPNYSPGKLLNAGTVRIPVLRVELPQI